MILIHPHPLETETCRVPKIPKYVERLCAYCADYEILVKPREGLPAGVGPFC